MKSDLGAYFTKEVLLRKITMMADELVPKPPTPDPNVPQKKLEKDRDGVNAKPIDREILVVDRLYSSIPTIEGAEEKIHRKLARKDLMQKIDKITR